MSAPCVRATETGRVFFTLECNDGAPLPRPHTFSASTSEARRFARALLKAADEAPRLHQAALRRNRVRP